MTNTTNMQQHLSNAMFVSERLTCKQVNGESTLAVDSLTQAALNLLTPDVVHDLPDSWQAINSQQQAANWLKARVKECQLFSITLTGSETVIGFILVYHNSDEAHLPKSQNIGYLIGRPYWKKGYASEALNAYIYFCQTHSPSVELYAGTRADNHGSINVLRKCGFEQCAPSNSSVKQLAVNLMFKHTLN